ncbi:MAG TPA: ACP S-malonyltransferase [Firmicutes bacterium]|nr:ACP S-malonyltransferase [Bacillota bacterium]
MAGWVFLFPGQGSQVLGMGRRLAGRFVSASRFLEAMEVESRLPLRQWMWGEDEAALLPTSHTQPALLAVELAYLRVLEEAGIHPQASAGHSLGELAALVAARVLTPEAAVRLAVERGRCMEAAAPPGTGGMAAVIGLGDAEVEALCAEVREESGEPVEPVNYNCPGQVVVAGRPAALDLLVAKARAKGAKLVRPLSVSGPFHSRLMQPAAEEFARALSRETFSDPSPGCLLVSSVTGEPVENGEMARSLLARQVAAPVRWTRTLETLAARGFRQFVEVGPGRVLAGLVRRTLPGALVICMEEIEADARDLQAVFG